MEWRIFDKGKFESFFGRIIEDIKDNLGHESSLCGNYEKEIAEMFIVAFKSATKLPDNYGRLVDASIIDDNIYNLTKSLDLYYDQFSKILDNTPTIIESNMEE